MGFLKLQFIKTFLTRLSKREKTVLYAASLIISLAILDKLVVSPIHSKMKDIADKIEEKELGIKKSFHVLAHKDRISRESAKYANFFAETKSSDEEITLIMKEIENLANKSSVYIVDMKPSGIKTTGTSKRYFIKLNCEAQMTQLVDFMYGIENSSKLLSIDMYQITPKSKDSTIAVCNMSIFKIVLE